MIDNEILESLSKRKSVRAYTGDPVTKEQIEALITAAAQAPTAGNQQLYTILKITDAPLKARLAMLCDNQPFIEQAPLAFVFLADCERWQQLYRLAGETPRAPGLGDLMLAVSDAVIAAQNMVVAAESMGLGSCYIGDIMENCEAVREALHLPAHVFPATMLVLGVPTEQQKQREKPSRFKEEMFVFENTYHLPDDEALRALLIERQSRARGAGHAAFDFDKWVKAFCHRKYESDFSKEMSRSAQEYLKEFKK